MQQDATFSLVQVDGAPGIRQVAALARQIWNECYAKTLTPEQIDYMLEQFQSSEAVGEQLEKDGYHYYLVFSGGVPVGYVAFVPRDRKLFLSKIYLLEAHRGKRWTDYLFSFLEEQAIEFGCNAIWLTVNKYNQRAIRAYEKRGFTTIREEVTDIGKGYVMDDYVMEKAVGKTQ